MDGLEYLMEFCSSQVHVMLIMTKHFLKSNIVRAEACWYKNWFTKVVLVSDENWEFFRGETQWVVGST